MFLSSGANDPMAPREAADRLVSTLRELGADVTVHRHDRGHGIDPDDVAAAASWLTAGASLA